MRCSNCGAELRDGFKFCRYCGAKIDPAMADRGIQIDPDIAKTKVRQQLYGSDSAQRKMTNDSQSSAEWESYQAGTDQETYHTSGNRGSYQADVDRESYQTSADRRSTNNDRNGDQMVNDSRQFWKYLVFGVLTAGIYAIWFEWSMITDLNIACGYVEDSDENRSPGYLVRLLLSIITFNIYQIYWYYKQGQRLKDDGDQYGLRITDKGSTYLLWMLPGTLLFGIGPIIAVYKFVKNCNRVCRQYNRAIMNGDGRPRRMNQHRRSDDGRKKSKGSKILLIIAGVLVLFLMIVGILYFAVRRINTELLHSDYHETNLKETLAIDNMDGSAIDDILQEELDQADHADAQQPIENAAAQQPETQPKPDPAAAQQPIETAAAQQPETQAKPDHEVIQFPKSQDQPVSEQAVYDGQVSAQGSSVLPEWFSGTKIYAANNLQVYLTFQDYGDGSIVVEFNGYNGHNLSYFRTDGPGVLQDGEAYGYASDDTMHPDAGMFYSPTRDVFSVFGTDHAQFDGSYIPGLVQLDERGAVINFDSSVPDSEEGIHRYEYYVEDCTWNQAFQRALEKGGYLAHINSREEYDYLISEISQRGLNSIRFMLGGRRSTESTSYFWVDEYNNTYGPAINSPEYWAYSAWMQGEPSLVDGDILETCMCMFYSSDYASWVLNDVPEDILAVVPDFSGKIGYIVEYEDGTE